MTRRSLVPSVGLALALALAIGPSALAAGPERSGDSYTETFDDDFLLELCGIETRTTLTERWTFTVFPDGTEVLHVRRLFVPEDPRIPIEMGAATSTWYPDGTRKISGTPLHLIGANGTVLIDAGQSVFEDDRLVRARGQKPDLSDLARYYCP